MDVASCKSAMCVCARTHVCLSWSDLDILDSVIEQVWCEVFITFMSSVSMHINYSFSPVMTFQIFPYFQKTMVLKSRNYCFKRESEAHVYIISTCFSFSVPLALLISLVLYQDQIALMDKELEQHCFGNCFLRHKSDNLVTKHPSPWQLSLQGMYEFSLVWVADWTSN